MAIRFLVKLNTRVMSGRHLVAAETRREAIKRSELQAAVASHTWNRRLAVQVTVDERLDHITLEIAFEVQDIKREAQLFGHAPRVVHVIERTAARRQRLPVLVHTDPAPLIPQLHREPNKLVSLYDARRVAEE